MEVYSEVIYLFNFIVILLCNEIVDLLLDEYERYKSLIIRTFLLNQSLIVIAFKLHFVLMILFQISVFYLFFKRRSLVFVLVYNFVYISIVMFLSKVIEGLYLYYYYLIFNRLTLLYFILFILIIVLSIYIFIIIYRHNHKKSLDLTKVSYQKKEYVGLIDSGNLSFYRGMPLIYMNKSIINDYQLIDQIRIETINDEALVDVIILDEISINSKIYQNIYAGLIDNEHYDFILSKYLLGGQI